MALDDARIRATVRAVLDGADLDVLTSRRVRQDVGARLGIVNVDDYKQLIEAEVKAFLDEHDGQPLQFTPAAGEKRAPGPADDSQPPAKRVAAQSAPGEFELAPNRRVVVRQFNGRQLVDVREFYEKDGEQRPGAKGLALSQPQWAALRAGLADARQAVAAEQEGFTLELGSNRRLSLGRYRQRLQVNLREYYEKEGQLAPGKKGIALSVAEWEALLLHADAIDAAAGGPPKQPAASAQPAAAAAPGAAAAAAAVAAAGAPPAAVAAAGGGGGGEGGGFLDLGASRRASLSEWKGSQRLNLREYYNKDGQMLPGKKGISLPREQAAKLQEAAGQLSGALAAQQELSLQLGPLCASCSGP